MVLPAAAADLTEAPSRALAQQVKQVLVSTPLVEAPIPSTYVRQGQGTPILLLHGFDSSLLEFRRLLPLLATTAETWALDLLGFGFSDRTLSPSFDPGAIKLHLHSFWQQQIGQPMVLVGASMGGAAALDFTLTYPDAVQKLVLLDSAGFAAGPAMEKVMVPPLDRWATAFLKNAWVRRRISLQAYCDRAWVTPDAELCASLHLACPRWSEALIAFTKSGGYNFLSDKISQITVPTQVIWGRQDQILGTADAEKFVGAIANSQLTWIDQCGHVPHLEQAQATAEVIMGSLK
ncbi:MAG: alpha/beta fold hydrolase [Leptolyngbya sp. RL_3_1]|nr:alpha/beta fold hydrolase [Leptolyngbya sp. RL_3_1]